MMEPNKFFIIGMYGIILLVGMLAWQINGINNNMRVIDKNIITLDKNINVMDDNFYDQLHYQIGKIRGHLLANNTVDDDNVTGRYYPTNMNILIYAKARNVDSIHKTAYHEIGHYIWHEILNKSIRDEWLNTTFDCYPTNYSKESPTENFADSYAFWYKDELECQPQLDILNKIGGLK